MTDINLELDLASNLFGKLDKPLRRRIENLVKNPCQETWDNAYSIIIASTGMTTLWQAVLKVDPTFPVSKSEHDHWPRVPDRETIVQALRYATH